ncbi:MAG: nitroreductase family protein [Phormidesmis sp.]
MNSLLLSPTRKFYHRLRFVYSLLTNCAYDYSRYLKFSATLAPTSSQKRCLGRITANYHVIEKGLSFKDTRVGFGSNVVNKLMSLLEDYQTRYGLDETAQVALNVLYRYYEFNLEHELDNPQLLQRLNKLKATLPAEAQKADESASSGGVLQVTKAAIKQSANVNFREFTAARYSIRHFGEGTVDRQIIEEAVSIALKTPSVCNRQSWKVYAFSDDKAKQTALSYQSGNRGFGSSADKVLVVTTDLNYFIGAKERNQCFIDGGLFSMSLIYALHSLGVGTCCLNWSVTREVDRALKKAVDIPQADSIIMMIAVGHLPEQFKVAFSARRPYQDVLVEKS